VSFGLIEQPVLGWSDPAIWGAMLAGVALLVSFVAFEARTAAPMLPLGLFARRNFAVANAQTFADVRRHRAARLLRHDLPAAGGRLQRAQVRRHGTRADGGDVPSVGRMGSWPTGTVRVRS